MNKKLLLFLVLLLMHYFSFSQGAEIKGNCLYDNTTKRITVRLALRNPTGITDLKAFEILFIGFLFIIRKFYTYRLRVVLV